MPSEHVARLGCVALQDVDFRRAEVARVELDVLLPVEIEIFKRFCKELAYAVAFTGRYNVVVGVFLLKHQPHRLDVIARETPVTLCVEVAEVELFLQAELNACSCFGDLARNERFPAAG